MVYYYAVCSYAHGVNHEGTQGVMNCSVTFIYGSHKTEVTVREDQSFLSALRENNLPAPPADCGGRGKCGKCTAILSGAVRSSVSGEIRHVDAEELLLCQYAPAGDCLVLLQKEESIQFFQGEDAAIKTLSTGLGLAVDIGTTTVETRLYDLSNGSMIASNGRRNAQRTWGADVISRITACSKGELSALCDAIRHQIVQMAEEACLSAGIRLTDIKTVSVAGNTVMEHIFAGLDPTGIGIAPFTPVSLFGFSGKAADYLAGFGPDTDIYLSPCISGYVGGDITAGLLSSGGDTVSGLRLFVDIGTNGEMALGDQSGWVTCATAAGPAFEGAEIACGMDGSPGAIDRVWIENGELKLHVIGECPAKGLCGSGLVDVIASLLELGVIDESGRMLGPDEMPPAFGDRLMTLPDGKKAFRLQDEVYLSAGDVRQLQLAKAAIRAGADTLLAHQGKTASDVAELIIAGGFGSFLNKSSALSIGLLPPVDLSRIRHVGNASVAGAAIALSSEGQKRLALLRDNCIYLELSGMNEFMDRYVDCMFFEGDAL